MTPEYGPKKLRQLHQLNRHLNVTGRKIWLTGYADASYKLEGTQHMAGWGIWVRDHAARIHRAGRCPDWVETAQDAELCAVWAAIHTALTKLDADSSNIMVIKTDCQSIARYFGWGRGCSPSIPAKADCRRIVGQALELALNHEVRLVVTWVKGHQGSKTTQGYLNNQVDKMARDARLTGNHRMQQFRV